MVLTNSLIRSIHKCFVLDESLSPRPSELNASERGNGSCGIKEILGIKDLVPVKEKCRTVEIVDAAFGNGVDDRTGRVPVLRSIVAGENGELLDTVHSQIQSGRATGGSIRIVVDAYAVYTITVLIGAVAGIAQLVSKAAVSFVRAKSCPRLVGDARDSWFECRQGGPIAAVKWQFAHRRGIDCCTDGGGSRLHVWRSRAYLDGLIELPHFQTQVQSLLRADRKLDVLLNRGLKPLSRHADFIRARKQVGCGIEAVSVRGDLADNARAHILDTYRGTRHGATAFIGDQT